MNALTAGTWEYFAGSGIKADGKLIASTSYKGKGISQRITYEELEANGRGIAAVPDLLEAVELARAVLRDCSDEAGDVDRWNEGGDGYNAMHAIDAALRKAGTK